MKHPLTRRQLGWTLAGFGVASGQSKPSTTIHFEVDYHTKPERIYKALLDAKQFSAFSGLPAQIDAHAGGAFKLFDAQIEGRNVELIVNQRIVQAWRPASWPAGVYSIARFELADQGSGTRIAFDHTGFPEDKMEHLRSGWEEHYWGPLRKYLSA